VDASSCWFKDASGDLSRAVDVDGGDMTIEGATFTSIDTNVILYVHDGGSLTVRNSVFTANTSNAILSANGDLDFSNNLITNNVYLGALLVLAGDTSMSQWVWNNTISGNSSPTCSDSQGCPAISAASAGQIENNIVADNDGGGIYVGYPEQVTVQYNDGNGNGAYDICLMGRYECESTGSEYGNLTSDPKLNDPEAGDYTLSGFSPCVDAGNPLAGYDDVDGSRNDMGAFGGPYGAW
jgi:hypothetical protein